MKAEFTMITMAGSLASAGFVGVFMNGKERLLKKKCLPKKDSTRIIPENRRRLWF